MAKSLIGSQTLLNLMKAFAGESQARNRYTFYANVAKKEGYMRIYQIFTDTAENERKHAEVFFKHMIEGVDGDQKVFTNHVDADYPVGKAGTLFNLRTAAAGENEEWTSLYPEFARVADEEGFAAIAASFRKIAEIEKHHDERYTKLAALFEAGFFKRNEPVIWECMECGNRVESTTAPTKCPVCGEPQSDFRVYCGDL